MILTAVSALDSAAAECDIYFLINCGDSTWSSRLSAVPGVHCDFNSAHRDFNKLLSLLSIVTIKVTLTLLFS